jgi:DNA-binding MarR family transcriptional regulator
MLLLARDRVSTQRDLIRQTGSDKAGMTRTVEDLEGLGLLERTRSPRDKRVANIVLTESGWAVFHDARQRADGAAQQLFEGFSTEELEDLAATLDRFTQRTDNAD